MSTDPVPLYQDYQLELFAQTVARGRQACDAAMVAGLEVDADQADAIWRSRYVQDRVHVIQRERLASIHIPDRAELQRDAADIYSRAIMADDTRTALSALRLRAELAGELDGAKPAKDAKLRDVDELRRDVEAQAKRLGFVLAPRTP